MVDEEKEQVENESGEGSDRRPRRRTIVRKKDGEPPPAAKVVKRRRRKVKEESGKEPEEDLGEIDEPSRDAPAVHELAGEDEEGDGQKGEAVQSRGHALRNGGEGGHGLDGEQHGAKGGDADAEGDGHAQQEQAAEAQDEYGNIGIFHHSLPFRFNTMDRPFSRAKQPE